MNYCLLSEWYQPVASSSPINTAPLPDSLPSGVSQVNTKFGNLKFRERQSSRTTQKTCLTTFNQAVADRESINEDETTKT